MCISFQGNGDSFGALLGPAVAALERGLEPRLVFGGSSASVVAPLVRTVLDNESVRNARVVIDGVFLSFRHAPTLRGTRGSVFGDFEWDDPFKGNDDDMASRALELALLGDRDVLILATYQHATKRFDEALGLGGSSMRPLRSALSAWNYSDARTPDELSTSARAVLWGRGVATTPARASASRD